MELEIVRFFQSWSCKALDVIIGIINEFGTDLFFYLAFFALYWVYSKGYAFKFMFVYLSSCGFNKVFKSLVKRPRPEGAVDTGYSFPSGHATSYACVSTQLVYETKRQGYPKKTWQKIDMWIEYILMGLLVCVARMYFGAHYLTDVLAGLLLGAFFTVAVTYLLNWFIEKFKGKIKYEIILICLAPVVLAVYFVVMFTHLITDLDTLAKVYRFIGLFLAIVVGYFVDKKFIKYDPSKDSTKEKTSKVCIGLGVLIASYVLFLSNKPVDFKLGIYYFVVGLFATIVLPWIFKTINNQLAKAGEKNDVKTEEKGE